MRFVDHTLGLAIRSDVEILDVPHSVHKAPVGLTGLSGSMKSSTEKVIVNGEHRPGWKFVNSPFFDSHNKHKSYEDTICFELFNQDGVKVWQWSAFLSSGNVRIRTGKE